MKYVEERVNTELITVLNGDNVERWTHTAEIKNKMKTSRDSEDEKEIRWESALKYVNEFFKSRINQCFI